MNNFISFYSSKILVKEITNNNNTNYIYNGEELEKIILNLNTIIAIEPHNRYDHIFYKIYFNNGDKELHSYTINENTYKEIIKYLNIVNVNNMI